MSARSSQIDRWAARGTDRGRPFSESYSSEGVLPGTPGSFQHEVHVDTTGFHALETPGDWSAGVWWDRRRASMRPLRLAERGGSGLHFAAQGEFKAYAQRCPSAQRLLQLKTVAPGRPDHQRRGRPRSPSYSDSAARSMCRCSKHERRRGTERTHGTTRRQHNRWKIGSPEDIDPERISLGIRESIT